MESAFAKELDEKFGGELNGQTGPDKGSGVGNLTIPNVARLGLVSGLTGGVSQFWQGGWEFAV